MQDKNNILSAINTFVALSAKEPYLVPVMLVWGFPGNKLSTLSFQVNFYSF